MEALTAKAKAPKSRKEAWAAWEANLVTVITGDRPHLKKWATAFTRKQWWLFAQDVRPNRMEVLVNDFHTGNARWVRVQDPRGVRENARYWEKYRVLPQYEAAAKLQQEALSQRYREQRLRISDLIEVERAPDQVPY